MDTSTFLLAIQQHGPIVGTLVLLFFILKWVFKNQDRILTIANAQNEYWLKMIQEHIKIIQNHTENAKEFHVQIKGDHKDQKEANSFQRQEHGKMIATLTESITLLKTLNGNKKQCL